MDFDPDQPHENAPSDSELSFACRWFPPYSLPAGPPRFEEFDIESPDGASWCQTLKPLHICAQLAAHMLTRGRVAEAHELISRIPVAVRSPEDDDFDAHDVRDSLDSIDNMEWRQRIECVDIALEVHRVWKGVLIEWDADPCPFLDVAARALRRRSNQPMDFVNIRCKRIMEFVEEVQAVRFRFQSDDISIRRHANRLKQIQEEISSLRAEIESKVIERARYFEMTTDEYMLRTHCQDGGKECSMDTDLYDKSGKNLIYKERVQTGSHNYFMDIRRASNGKRFVVLCQSTKSAVGEHYDNKSMVIFQDELLEVERVFRKVMNLVFALDEKELLNMADMMSENDNGTGSQSFNAITHHSDTSVNGGR